MVGLILDYFKVCMRDSLLLLRPRTRLPNGRASVCPGNPPAWDPRGPTASGPKAG